MSAYILPLFVGAIFIAALLSGQKPYDRFLEGAKKALPFMGGLFPYLAAVFIMTALFEKSGLSKAITDLSAGFFGFFGIPKEIVPLLFIKPFSGAGSLSAVISIFELYGVDSYIGRCASVVYASSETVFYVGAVYFSACKKKPPLLPFLIILLSNFLSVCIGVLFCRIGL